MKATSSIGINKNALFKTCKQHQDFNNILEKIVIKFWEKIVNYKEQNPFFYTDSFIIILLYPQFHNPIIKIFISTVFPPNSQAYWWMFENDLK